MTAHATFTDIIGYEGLYAINEYGEILALPRTKANNHNSEFTTKTIKRTPVESKTGYQTIILTNEYGAIKKYYIHRLVAEHFIYNEFDKPEVNHKDGNKANNHVDNLEWMTHKENMVHAKENGLMACGEQSGKNILFEIDVLVIRQLLNQGVLTMKQIADSYGVCRTNISHIKHNRRWTHI